ncbi:G-type lectin S-receptor-like serine/threonine-protein kinase At4g27290 [Olea europaea var. sylvestris]|uniref:G-type lectin S-receptor-like serine/threonine-protein kinase At4g27290 n=1 Tax=Olea europaea var. sylvestris TaxID=158386 RepID=UPI000C1CEC28|nr:G-type lectin S-receptor-like serine/threonine-protein kinase At4g27290 [Olea europaea var. sylvestris]
MWISEDQRKLLDWPKCFHIINGTARGLMYLHQDSWMRIIHRDLKASNIFYTSPEYGVEGIYSIKSDVFSFGVLVLEIVSGKKNWGFSHSDHHLSLLEHGVLPEAKQPSFFTERDEFPAESSTRTNADKSSCKMTITLPEGR